MTEFKSAQIEAFIKKPNDSIKCFVVYGSNEGLIAEYVKRLTLAIVSDLYDPFRTVYLNEIDDEGVLSSEYNSRSLMGGRRVIVVKDAADSINKFLKNVLDKSQSDTLIIVSSMSFSKNSATVRLAKDREDMAVAACYEDRDEDIYDTAKKVFIENGFTINQEALQLLCSRLSNDRKTNLGEIEKLIIYMGDKRNITIENIRDSIADSSSLDTDDVCYYTAGGMTEKSQKAFTKLINEGVEMISIIRALTYHFQKILNCHALMEKGDSLDNAVKKMKIIFFRSTSFKKQIMTWNKEKIFGVLELLYKCEKDCKTTGMPAESMVSYMIMKISEAAARALR